MKNTNKSTKPAATSGAAPVKARKNIQKIEKSQIVWKVPECAQMYMSALTNPFDTPAGACIPCDLFPLNSQKTKVFLRGKLALGTTGYGFISCNPCVASDGAVVKYSTAASVGTNATLFSAYTNTADGYTAQSPYLTASFNDKTVTARVVAFGIRIKYVGQLMTRNGVSISYEDPDHQDVRRFSFDTLGAVPNTTLRRTGEGEWDHSLCYSGPANPTDVSFAAEDLGQYPLGANHILVLGIAGIAGDNYEFEYFQHCEYIGSRVVSKTPSHTDAFAFGKILEASKSVASEKSLSVKDAPSVWSKFVSLVANNLPAVAQVAFGAGRAILGKDLAGGGAMIASGIGQIMGGSPEPMRPQRQTERQLAIMA